MKIFEQHGITTESYEEGMQILYKKNVLAYAETLVDDCVIETQQLLNAALDYLTEDALKDLLLQYEWAPHFLFAQDESAD